MKACKVVDGFMREGQAEKVRSRREGNGRQVHTLAFSNPLDITLQSGRRKHMKYLVLDCGKHDNASSSGGSSLLIAGIAAVAGFAGAKYLK